MKICPNCEMTFSDEMNFCLEDGLVLVESEDYNSEQTLSLTESPTLQLSDQRRTNKESEVITQQQARIRQTEPHNVSRQPRLFLILGSLIGIGLLTSTVLVS